MRGCVIPSATDDRAFPDPSSLLSLCYASVSASLGALRVNSPPRLLLFNTCLPSPWVVSREGAPVLRSAPRPTRINPATTSFRLSRPKSARRWWTTIFPPFSSLLLGRPTSPPSLPFRPMRPLSSQYPPHPTASPPPLLRPHGRLLLVSSPRRPMTPKHPVAPGVEEQAPDKGHRVALGHGLGSKDAAPRRKGVDPGLRLVFVYLLEVAYGLWPVHWRRRRRRCCCCPPHLDLLCRRCNPLLLMHPRHVRVERVRPRPHPAVPIVLLLHCLLCGGWGLGGVGR